jgi:hypothetical protein
MHSLVLRQAQGLAALLVAAGWLGSAGCSASSDSTDGSSSLSQFVDCTKETRATPYAPGTVERSGQMEFDVTLVDNRPGAADAQKPPGTWVRGSNTWDLMVRDSSGQGVGGLTIETVPRMPVHNHGTSITPVTTDAGGGHYVISPLYLYMSGFWQITLNISALVSDGGSSSQLHPDSVVFNVCIPG